MVMCGDGGDDVGDHDAIADGHPVGDVPEDGLDQLGDRRLAQEADPDRGQRDSELARRQSLADVVDLVDRGGRAPKALLGHGLQLRLLGAHERELGGDEEPVQEHEQDDRDQVERRQVGALLLRGRSSSFIEPTGKP